MPTIPSKKIEFNYEYLTKQEDIARVLQWLHNRKFFVLDSETSGLNPFTNKIILFQIGDDSKQWLLDCRTIDLSPLGEWFANEAVVKLGQNIVFDIKFLMRLGFIFKNVADVMIAEQVIRCGLGMSASMEALVEHYLKIVIDKDPKLRASFATTPPNKFSKRQLEYAAGDCIYPILIARKQKKLIEERNLRATVKLENAVIPIIAKMSLTGMRLDVDKWVALYQKSVAKMHEAEKTLDLFFQTEKLKQEDLFVEGEIQKSINFSSWQQIVKALARKGYYLENTNKKTVALAAINKEIPMNFAQALLQYRIYAKKCSTYGLNFLKAINPETNHIHANFTQTRTSTGRLSSGDVDYELTDDSGEHEGAWLNFQNIPREEEYRECFIPDEGYKFIIYDFKAIEPRILGNMSHDPLYLTTFSNNKDIYGEVGQGLYHEEVSKAPGRPTELRDKSKIAVLGTSYGTGKKEFYYRLLVDLNLNAEGILKEEPVLVTKEESDRLWEGIFALCPKIKETLDASSSLADPLNSTRRVYDLRAAYEPAKVVYARLIEVLENSQKEEEEIKDLAAQYMRKRGHITYSESLNGRKRFFKVYHKNWWTDGRNHPIQSTASDIIKIAMVLIDNKIEELGYDATIVNQVHDEIIVMCKAEQAEKLNPYVKELMEAAGNKILKDVPVIAEGGIVDKWQK